MALDDGNCEWIPGRLLARRRLDNDDIAVTGNPTSAYSGGLMMEDLIVRFQEKLYNSVPLECTASSGDSLPEASIILSIMEFSL